MPIVGIPPVPVVTPQPSPVQVADAAYRHSVVDVKSTPLAALLTHIEGATWVVDYYSQVLSADEELSEYQPGQLPPYQQYSCIRNYELKLQGSLSTSDDAPTSVMSVTGSANLYPYLKPNAGDAFIADIGDGLAGQFTVTQVSKLSIFKETCFSINFELSRYVDADVLASLEQRVVRNGHFQKDYMLYGQYPVITSTELGQRHSLESMESTLLTQWLTDSYSREYSTVLVPGQSYSTYDPSVVKAILTLYNVRDNPPLRGIRELNCAGIPHLEIATFWDALLHIDADGLLRCFKTAQLLPVADFNRLPFLEGVRFSGIRQVVGATDAYVGVDSDYRVARLITGSNLEPLDDADALDIAAAYAVALATAVIDTPLPPNSVYGLVNVPAIHPVTVDNHYVLSAAFYNQTAGQSKLEHLVRDYFDNSSVNVTALTALVQSSRAWGRLERYYYTPILLAMLKLAQRSI